MTKAKYAHKTTVSPEKTRAEIELTLARYGCDAFGFAWEGLRHIVTFKFRGFEVRFEVNMPDPEDRRYVYKTSYSKRTEAQRLSMYSQEVRQKWRALLLSIKAKLESVDAEISTFEEEFLPWVVTPNGDTVAQWVVPQLREAVEEGRMLPMLPAGRL